MHRPTSRLAGATIVFDLDGTLIDTAPDLIAVLNHLLTDEGLPALPFLEARPLIGRGARVLIERGFSAAGAAVDPERLPALYEAFIARYRARIAEESLAFPGAPEALETLADAGARLAVCTNKPTDLSLALLEALALAGRFAAIVGADRASAPKPDPRHLLAAIAQAGGRADRAVMVGDSSADAQAARAAGVPLILVAFGYSEIPARDLGPDVLIDDFADLAAACERLLAPCPAEVRSV